MQQVAIEMLMKAASEPAVAELISDFCTYHGRVRPHDVASLRNSVVSLVSLLYEIVYDQFLLVKLKASPNERSLEVFTQALMYIQDLLQSVSKSSDEDEFVNVLTVLFIITKIASKHMQFCVSVKEFNCQLSTR